ncbi:MAG: translation initiation factor IF-2 subunit beta [Candidatus Helarchaeota archaeon]
MDYEEALKRAQGMIPTDVFEHKRFTIPRVEIYIEGGKTYLTNINAIATKLRREPNHILKYLLRELATRGSIRKKGSYIDALIFRGRFREFTLDSLIKKYAEKFVMCDNCNRPDTHLSKKDRFTFLVCEACGSRRTVATL